MCFFPEPYFKFALYFAVEARPFRPSENRRSHKRLCSKVSSPVEFAITLPYCEYVSSMLPMARARFARD